MKYRIINSEHAPAYLQLYKQLREDIVNGLYPYQGKLPSKRLIATETGVSTVTVEHAYALLCEEGYVETKERSGYYVCFRRDEGFMTPMAEASVSSFSFPGLIPDTSFEFPFSVLAKTMRSVLSDYGETILNRGENAGCGELRDALRRYLARSRGILADTEQIIIGSGSEYLYGLIVQLLGHTRTYGLESPSYEQIQQVYQASGASYVMLPLGPEGIKSAALHSCQADVLHLSPYRSFPSGVTASASKRHEYLRWASVPGRYLVEDDFESEFTLLKKSEETLFSHTEKDNVIYMNTFSKTISPSLRVGYMVLPKHLVPVFKEKLGFYSCTVPTFMQYVLAKLINQGDFERHINRVRRKKRSLT